MPPSPTSLAAGLGYRRPLHAFFAPGAWTPSVRVLTDGGIPRRGVAGLLRVDPIRLASEARARRRGRDGLLRARMGRGRGAVGGNRHPPRPRLRALSGPRDRAP